eukprot:2643607-Pyramimonas_sp.AAC.2
MKERSEPIDPSSMLCCSCCLDGSSVVYGRVWVQYRGGPRPQRAVQARAAHALCGALQGPPWQPREAGGAGAHRARGQPGGALYPVQGAPLEHAV